MRKEISIPIIGIAAGELMMYYNRVDLGLGIHMTNLLIMVLLLIFSNLSEEVKSVFQSLLLLLLLRMVSLSMPQFSSTALLWFPLVYGVMFIPIYLVIKNQQISAKELGVNFSRLHIYLPAALLIGGGMATIEYSLIKPAPLIESIGLPSLALMVIVMFFFVAASEEFIFRSILQTRLERAVGLKYGLLLSSSLFGIMHAGYGTAGEVLLAGLFGGILGYIFQKTRSLPLIVAVHGTANVILFGVLPIIIA
ncbi:MAG: CPBP family intramembrane metalloprotease [Candidatus Methanoperedens sp.]|nr:CPBP family intramembrane metalloprotease [Candidatus Methanoperedens sp.]